MTAKGLIVPVLALLVLLSCNDTPNVQPVIPAFSIYPNPVSDTAKVSIQVQNNQSFLFRMFDTKGKVIYEQTNLGNYSFNIDMSVCPVGTYEIIFTSGRIVIKKKLIKI